MFALSDLLSREDIVIQCHNVPDADTIASAYAIFTYLKDNGKQARIIYSGNLEITKPNLLELTVKLVIPIEYVREMPRVKTLVMADCQYGERNAEKFEADTVIVIDHHRETGSEFDFGVIRSQLGSCSTLVWDLLRKEQFDFEKYPNVSTALYYGLFTDTNSLEEIAHPLDKDARDGLAFNTATIKRLRNNNLTLEELDIAGMALTNHRVENGIRYASFRAKPCDPNILGFISDLALQVGGIDVCTVYNRLRGGYKLSVRSCAREVMANEFAQFLTEGIGSGGGHISKAGGFIEYDKVEGIDIEEFMEERAREYFNAYDVVDAADHDLKLDGMARYKKKNVPVGFVKSTDAFEEGTPMLIRSLEGDEESKASGNVYLMIGILGEVYPIKAEKFNNNYALCSEAFETDFDYFPTAKNKITGESVELAKYANSCAATGEVYIYSRPLSKNTKVFTLWSQEGYMLGKPGDQIAVRDDDHNDVYIIRRDIFEKTYISLD